MKPAGRGSQWLEMFLLYVANCWKIDCFSSVVAPAQSTLAALRLKSLHQEKEVGLDQHHPWVRKLQRAGGDGETWSPLTQVFGAKQLDFDAPHPCTALGNLEGFWLPINICPGLGLCCCSQLLIQDGSMAAGMGQDVRGQDVTHALCSWQPFSLCSFPCSRPSPCSISIHPSLLPPPTSPPSQSPHLKWALKPVELSHQMTKVLTAPIAQDPNTPRSLQHNTPMHHSPYSTTCQCTSAPTAPTAQQPRHIMVPTAPINNTPTHQ